MLAAVRALEPLAATAPQVAERLRLPIAYVTVLLERWADQGRLVRATKSCYRYRPDGTNPVAPAPPCPPHADQEGGRHEQQ